LNIKVPYATGHNPMQTVFLRKNIICGIAFLKLAIGSDARRLKGLYNEY